MSCMASQNRQDDGAVSRPSQSQDEAAPESSGLRPLLGESQRSILERYGSKHDVSDGDILFGDRGYDMIIILKCTVDIVEHHGYADARTNITYGPREFLGDMSLLTGQRIH